LNSEKLKIYASKDWVIPGKNTIVVLWPFWPAKELANSDPDVGRFKEYIEKGNEIFELTETLIQADIAVYPQEFTNNEECYKHLISIAAEVKQVGKKLLVYYNSDDDASIELDNCLLFRTSFYKSKQKKYEFAFPGWSVDFINYFPDKTFYTITDTSKPSVAYCGYINDEKKGLKTLVKSILRPTKKTYEDIAKAIRGGACRNLQRNNKVKTNFIIRNGFWAAGIEDKAAARKEYATNMFQSLYAIATRGGGNFSYRFYEILSCGRIPIFINTDAVLPYDTMIDWKKHVVWVEQDELNKIDEKLLSFHNSRSNAELIALQKSNRNLYEEFISPVGFHTKLKEFININN
jgi:hypothetical protein